MIQNIVTMSFFEPVWLASVYAALGYLKTKNKFYENLSYQKISLQITFWVCCHDSLKSLITKNIPKLKMNECKTSFACLNDPLYSFKAVSSDTICFHQQLYLIISASLEFRQMFASKTYTFCKVSCWKVSFKTVHKYCYAERSRYWTYNRGSKTEL